MSVSRDASLRQVGQLPSAARALAPPTVRATSDRVGEALDRARDARREVEQAEEHLAKVRREDRRAAADAAAADRRLPKSKVERAEKELETAQRRGDACEDALRQARAAFRDELRKHGDELRASIEDAIEREGRTAAAAVGTIESALTVQGELREALSGLDTPLGRFRVGSRHRRKRRDPLGGSQRQMLSGLRQTLGVD